MKEKISIETMKLRYSCRSYTGEPLSAGDRAGLEEYVSSGLTGPFGGRPGFTLIAAEPGDTESLKTMGTYGFIRKPAGFIIGEMAESPMYLEDFGYCMERVILHATAMGLGTCWLGGTFKRSRFAEKAGISDGMTIPAVAAVGYMADRKTVTERLIRTVAGSDKRKSAEELFFSGDMKPLNPDFFNTGYGTALEMVRRGPSASNKQPWRVIRGEDGRTFHFFMERTPGYNQTRFLKADLQRVDMGIAMCHFELAASVSGLDGSWNMNKPENIILPLTWEYTASWTGR